jgi:hypothetical protein
MHLLGGAVGGIATAALAFAALRVAGIGESVRVTSALGIVGVALLFDSRVLPLRLPSPKRQVPVRWREYFRPPTTAFLYGIGLGTGVTTRVYFATTYAVFLVAALTLPFVDALVVGAVYGASRSAGVWIAYGAGSLEDLRLALSHREERRWVVKVLNIAALVALGFVLAI